MTFTITICMR